MQVIRRLTSGAATQVLGSLANFAYTLVLVRQVTPAAYGTFAIGFACMLLLGGLGQSMLLTPLTVASAGRSSSFIHAAQRRALGYLTGFAVIFLCLGLTLAYSFAPQSTAHILAVFVPISVAYLFREFYVRQLLDNGRFLQATMVNASFLLILTAAELSLLYTDDRRLYAHLLSYLVALTGAASYGAIASRLRAYIRPTARNIGFLRLLFRSGKWACLTTLAFNLRTQAANLFSFGVIGLAELAQLNAHRVLVSPLLLLIPSVMPVLLKQIATQARREPAHVRTSGLNRLLFGATMTTAGYGAALGIAYPWLQEKVFPSYAPAPLLLLGWCIYAAILFPRCIVDTALQAHGKFSRISIATVAIGIFSAPLSLLLSWASGAVGALIAMIAMELALFAWLYTMARR